ncbi:UNVERIFIED_CONTAM: putative protein phosphatase 2C 25 [Sesamum angustifolium]|uniref:protein-serine/threonine phosphatase n=1 Tax=Sesamum angustifolium TaxID=2727405 RepID=A0AAW2LD69_9LAMI
MHCAVAAVSSSPIFTPSPRKLSPIFCKPATSPPPATLSSPSSFAIKNIRGSFNGGEEEDVGSPKAPAMLKRKRPGRISIPVASLGFEDIKKTTDLDRSSDVELEGEGYSVCCKERKRGGFMEDRYAAVLGLQGDSKQAFFGVFDGHGGAGAAEFAAQNLEKNVMNELSKRREEVEEAVKEGYLITDGEFLKEEIRGGTCCVTALIHKGDLVVSNAGDCRAVMSRGGVAEPLTVDHRPSLDDERERIESLVSNQEAVDVVRSLCIGVDKPEAFSACKKLVDLSLTRGSLDDISVMILIFKERDGKAMEGIRSSVGPHGQVWQLLTRFL